MTPLPDVLPVPEPRPRPSRFLVLVEPLLGASVWRVVPIAILPDWKTGKDARAPGR